MGLITGSELFDTLMVFLKKISKKLILKKISRQRKSRQNFPGSQELSENDYHTFSTGKNCCHEMLIDVSGGNSGIFNNCIVSIKKRDEDRTWEKFLMEF